MRKTTRLFIIFLAVIAMSGCKKDKKYNNDDIIREIDITKKPTPTQIITPEPTKEPEIIEETHEGEMRSTLSGLWVPVEVGNRRPYAIQFSNFKTVRNQWGIGQADIVYEALVEGGITRFLAIGENFTGDRLGSVRSSRHYFVSLADEYDAIYIHYGKTKYAVSKLKELKIDNLDGETGIGNTVFYRDKSMKAPHNAFTGLAKILEGIKQKGYETKHSQDFEPHYKGYYITNGRKIDITWKKKEKDKWMRYFDSTGVELTINPGKTYIAIFPDNKTNKVVIE